MKKFLFGCVLAACMCSALYADSVEDAQFKQYVELTRMSPENPEGMTVVADNTYRIIYLTMPIALDKSSVTPDVISAMKAAMFKEMAQLDEDCKIVKNLKISFVFTFVTSDKDIFSITFSYKDL